MSREFINPLFYSTILNIAGHPDTPPNTAFYALHAEGLGFEFLTAHYLNDMGTRVYEKSLAPGFSCEPAIDAPLNHGAAFCGRLPVFAPMRQVARQRARYGGISMFDCSQKFIYTEHVRRGPGCELTACRFFHP